MNQHDSEQIINLCRNYTEAEVTEVKPFGTGHINETFLVTAGGAKYICQRLQPLMDTGRLKRNYLRYSKVLQDAGIRFPLWLPRRNDGEYFTTMENGDHWRIYPFLTGYEAKLPLSEEEAEACGRGLAELHQALQNLPEKPEAVYPMLHDLPYYLERYRNLIGSTNRSNAFRTRSTSESEQIRETPPALCLEAQRDPEMEEQIEKLSERFLTFSGKMSRKAVIHGDAKLANMLFQDGTVTAFLDLDTVMEGLILEDLADLIRSAGTVTVPGNDFPSGSGNEQSSASAATADSRRFDPAISDAILRGYLSARNGLLTSEEISLLPEAISKICFELALRYYTDSISVNKSFREPTPGYRLMKARIYMEMIPK